MKAYLELKNSSNDSVRVTLWPEIRKTFDESKIPATEPPVVVAVSSTKVQQFIGYSHSPVMQLSSTPATCIFVNPNIPELPQLINRYKELNYPPPTLPTGQPQNAQEAYVTITTAMDLFNKETTCKQFYCHATITDIIAGENKAWYYTSCNQCTGRAFKTEATNSDKGKGTAETMDFYKCYYHLVVTDVIP
ncbi:uncharacterized protein LOC143606948, partial [Bidens hawaiensis]|uniref:uncharacterized protein LOC143606948 n=1 Tax=Bidens hawaiensis TaxID=980011 RepID=UPI00404A00E8